MSVLYQMKIVMQTQPAAIVTDLFFAHVIVDIMEMELSVKVQYVDDDEFVNHSSSKQPHSFFQLNKNSLIYVSRHR
jgi:hypothetical protein